MNVTLTRAPFTSVATRNMSPETLPARGVRKKVFPCAVPGGICSTRWSQAVVLKGTCAHWCPENTTNGLFAWIIVPVRSSG